MISVASGPLPVLPDLDPGVAGHSAVQIPCSIQRERQSREHHKIGVELPTPPIRERGADAIQGGGSEAIGSRQ